MSERPSVLMVANWDSDVGYAWWLMESYWVTLAELYAESHTAIVAFPSISSLSDPLSRSDIEIVEQELRPAGLSGAVEVWRFVKTHNVDVVYFSDRSTWSTYYPVYRAAGVRKIVVHDHTPGLRPPAQGFKRFVKKVLNRTPWLSVDGALGATDFVARRLIETTVVPPRKVFAVPNGIPDARDASAADSRELRSELRLPEDRVVCVTVSRANRYKQIDFVLRCLARIAEDQRPHYLFVGDGPDLDYFRDSAGDLGITSSVTFAGRRSDIPELLAIADFAVHPSQGEVGYSLSILEYMQAGLAVVVPNNPSVCAATTHEETGLLFEEGNEASAIRAIERLTRESSLRLSLGQRARSEVDERFRLEHAHQRLRDAFCAIDPPRVRSS